MGRTNQPWIRTLVPGSVEGSSEMKVNWEGRGGCVISLSLRILHFAVDVYGVVAIVNE